MPGTDCCEAAKEDEEGGGWRKSSAPKKRRKGKERWESTLMIFSLRLEFPRRARLAASARSRTTRTASTLLCERTLKWRRMEAVIGIP